MATASELLHNWLHGTANGGPNGDGRYPLIGADGETYLIKCPAAQALDPTMDPSELEVFANTAVQAANEASAAAESASTSASNAAASATAADTSRSQALSYRNTASTHATTATTKASEAASSASAAAGSASTASTANTNAQSAKTAAETARTKAQQWADNNEDVAVESGKFSAKHWAAKAAASAAALANIAWSAISGKPSITAGNGLTGGGLLDTSKTITLGTPSTLSGSTTNAVTSTSHTHALSTNLSAWDGKNPSNFVEVDGLYGKQVEDYDAIVNTGLYRGNAGVTGAPINYTTMLHISRGGGRASQLAFTAAYTTNRLFFRNMHDTWNGWSEVWHSDNFNAAGALTYRQLLGGSVDLNTITDSGLYHQNSNANAGSGTNYPVSSAGMLTVISANGFVFQSYQHYLYGTVYTRSYYNGNWSSWVTQWDSRNYDPDSKQDKFTGSTSQYVRGNGTLATFPSIPQGTVTSVTGGNGLSGSVTSSGSISLGTPSTLSGSTTNSVTSTSHTHALSTNLSAWDTKHPDTYIAIDGANGQHSDDLDSINRTGFYKTEVGATGSPGNYQAVLHLQRGGSRAAQIAINTTGSDPVVDVRMMQSTWSSWRRVWHSGNLLDIGTSASSARSALGLGSSATIDASASNTGSTLVQRNGSGDVFARLFRSEYTSTAGAGSINYIMVQYAVGAGADNYIRPATPYTIKSVLGISQTPNIFVQSGDPGSSANTGDLWVW